MSDEHGQIKHLKCCKRSSTYKPDLIRTHPFKWISFPIFLITWFVLFWFILCPIVYKRVTVYLDDHKENVKWPVAWPYYFWTTALFVFCVILIILVALWKGMSSKFEGNYDKVLLNPEYGDNKEIICFHCSTFHPPGGQNCPCNSDICAKCGNKKESYNACCQKNLITEDRILKGPVYDVTIRKQQPESEIKERSKRRKSSDMKRNSLKSIKSGSSGVVVISSAHDANTKDLINKKVDTLKNVSNANPTQPNQTIAHQADETQKSQGVKSKKPNLQPVDVDLANRHANVEFFGEKIPLGNTTRETVVNVRYSKTSHPSESQTPLATPLKSVSSMDSMNKQNFNQFLHLVEINSPFTPVETVVTDDNTNNPPMSPREIFFYDLIQAAEKCESGNSPDSTHFGFYGQTEKKRPVSHILLASEVNLEQETDKTKLDALKRHTINVKPSENKNRIVINNDLESPRILALTEAIKLHTSEGDNDEEKTIIRDDAENKTTVKILRSFKKSTPEAEALKNPTFDRKSTAKDRNNSQFSEQTSAKELNNLSKESVTMFFISDTNQGPPKPVRQSVSVEAESSSNQCTDVDNDEVFSK